MVSLRFKLVWIVVALLGAYLVVNNASAYGGYSRLPSGLGELTPPINIDFTSDTMEDLEGGIITQCNSNGVGGVGAKYILAARLVGGEYLSIFSFDFETWTTGALSDTGGTLPEGAQIERIVFGCSDSVSNIDVSNGLGTQQYANDFFEFEVIEGGYSSLYYSIAVVTPIVTNQTWGNDGFWGASVTTDDIKDDMVASVQATGADLWPLLIFVGITLAFAIFGLLVTSIKTSVKPKTARRRSKTFDPVEFNRKADELQEFYSKTGGADPKIVEQIKKTNK